MTVFTDEEARKRLAEVLDEARARGEVRIRANDGSEYAIRPVPTGRSAMDVGTVKLGLTADEIVELVREGRERTR
jgi:hypothetical protein